MRSELAIEAAGLGKLYRLGREARVPYSTLRDGIAAALSAPFRRRSGERPTRATIWALRDVSFAIGRGEVVGIIGPNGAGKSTLLKILSRITEPTLGMARIHGRVGSLLEVGTGFHPELTGRENIYLNGAILGMRRAEIRRKFDEIVAFSEVEKFIDTQVKFYSSGMYLRLAFAVAAHLEPEILLVDEVLAVGDASFQRKSLGKMGEVAQEGRTVLFVSHNMTAIHMLCPRTILIQNGGVRRDGPTSEVVADYLSSVSEQEGERVWPDPETAPGNDRIRLHAVRVRSRGRVAGEVDIDQEVTIEVEFWNRTPGSQVFTNLRLIDDLSNIVLETSTTPGANRLPERWFGRPHPPGLFRSSCVLPANLLNDRRYYVTVLVASSSPPTVEAKAEQALSFAVLDTGAMRTPGLGGRWTGAVRLPLAWTTDLIESPVPADAADAADRVAVE
jgi:lipopolysaccharide transport system ATP-binding protein